MKRNMMIALLGMTACSFITVQPVNAYYVIPRIGGGETIGYPMIMPEIYFDGQSVLVLDEYMQPFPTLGWHEAPVLRALVPPAEFDPEMPWHILTGKAYNYQYGWDSQFLDEYSHPFPSGSGVWIQMLEQSEHLETYYRDSAYEPIFTTADPNGNVSSDIWYWDKGMRHNTYAVQEGYYGRFKAVYKVYLGDISTGEELVDESDQPVYNSTIVTQTWMVPCPYILNGDIDSDCIVDIYDFSLVADQWLASNCVSPSWCELTDINENGSIDIDEVAMIAANWLIDCLALPLDTACTAR